MEKLDLKKTLKHLYQPSAREVERVVVPTMNFLKIDGRGDPNSSQEYTDAVATLFTIAYAIKFMTKKGAPAIDYGVMPLEGLWWADDMSQFANEDKSGWQWTMMIAQPPFITQAMADTAIAEVKAKKNPAAISRLRFEAYTEGPSAQILHIGPFSAEGPTIEKLHRFIETSGHSLRGKHHEIYLSDITKADPEKWKTIIRQPISPSQP
ncbi:MAG: GyrI-like domain-containing protein [Methylococcaceae bacterium]|nr:GyrI-like domain-containing protein [Methylococcaceae bacterium]